MLECVMCNKLFNSNYELKRHMNKQKNVCIEKMDILKCPYCNKNFASKRTKRVHITKTCKMKNSHFEKDKTDIMLNKIKSLENENDEMKKLLKNSNIIFNGNIENSRDFTIINGSVYNIQINKFGEEDLGKILTSELCNNIMKSCEDVLYNAIEAVYFDPKHPENHNIWKTNKKDSYVTVYNGEKCISQHKNKVYKRLMHYLFKHLHNMLYNNDAHLNEKIKKILEDAIDDFIIKNKQKIDLYQDRIGLTLYNGKDIAMKTHKN